MDGLPPHAPHWGPSLQPAGKRRMTLRPPGAAPPGGRHRLLQGERGDLLPAALDLLGAVSSKSFAARLAVLCSGLFFTRHGSGTSGTAPPSQRGAGFMVRAPVLWGPGTVSSALRPPDRLGRAGPSHPGARGPPSRQGRIGARVSGWGGRRLALQRAFVSWLCSPDHKVSRRWTQLPGNTSVRIKLSS